MLPRERNTIKEKEEHKTGELQREAMHREKNNTTTITKKGAKVNVIAHQCSQTIAGKWAQACRVEISTKEMTMKVLNIM